MAENQNTTAKNERPKHRRQIGAFAGILVSLMLLLSIVSYSAADQASGEISLWDLLKIFSNDETILLKAATTQNWLGLFGAIISNWCINATIGYAVIILPLLGFVWSIYLLNQKELRKKWLMQQLLSGKKRIKGFEKEKWRKIGAGEVFESFTKKIVN